MFVYYRKDYWQNYQIHYLPISYLFCCEKIKDHWHGRPTVEVGAFGFGRLDFDTLNKVKEICLYYYERGWEGDYTWHSIPIKFCPFCSEKIHLVEIKFVFYIELLTDIGSQRNGGNSGENIKEMEEEK